MDYTFYHLYIHVGPNNVTITGVQASAMVVELLMNSEAASGLFDKAIAQSEYATWPLSISIVDKIKKMRLD